MLSQVPFKQLQHEALHAAPHGSHLVKDGAAFRVSC